MGFKVSFWSRWVVPLAFFGVGWCGGNLLISNGYVPDRVLHPIVQTELRLLQAFQSFLPEEIIQRYGVAPNELEARIKMLGEENGNSLCNGAGGRGRISFLDVLEECNIGEQIKFLEDHFLEDIPFFFITDILYAWTQLHRQHYWPEKLEGGAYPQAINHHTDTFPDPTGSCSLISTTTTTTCTSNNNIRNSHNRNNSSTHTCNRDCGTLCPVQRAFYEQIWRSIPREKEKKFESKVLCEGVVAKWKDNVIPFDVSVCAMAVLASSSRKNRELLAGLIVPTDLVEGYRDYISRHTKRLRGKSETGSDGYVSSEEVDCATRSLLYALEEGKRSVDQSFMGRIKKKWMLRK